MNLLTAKMDDEDEALSSSEPAVAHHQSMDFELTTSTVTATTAATADANDDDINDEEVFTSSELSPHAAAAAAVTGTESLCRVCGDGGAGIYFGAVVCVPCKTFFLRYASDSLVFSCKYSGNCTINPSNRTQCKYCRYHKCVEAGMTRRGLKPMHVQLHEGQHMCAVCNDVANGIHFGALTCEGCKKFFRRGLVEHKTYSCKGDMNCVINPRTRNACRYCRYLRCLAVGMSRDAIQMGRPSKHRLQTTAASLRQRGVDSGSVVMKPHEHGQFEFRLPEDDDHDPSGQNGFSSGRGDMKQLAAHSRLSVGSDENGWRGDDRNGTLMLMMTDNRALMPGRQQQQRQRRSFGSDADNFSIDSIRWSASTSTVSAPPGVRACGPASVVKMECQTSSDDDYALLTSSSTAALPVTSGSSSSALGFHSPVASMGLYPSDKQFTVSWQAAAGTAGSRSGGGKLLQTSQHVLSGGYCCETLTSSTAVSRPQPVVSHYIVSPVTNSPPLFGDSAAMTYCTGPTTTTTATVTTPGNMASLSLHGLTGNRQLLATPTAAATGTAAAADTDMCDASSLSLAVSHPADTVGVHTPDSDSSRAHPLSSSVSPSGSGGKWTHHISSDRDSPYVSVMALASTCHLFSESCPTAASGDDDDTALGYYNQASSRYWLEPADLPDENVIFTEKHCEMINQITAAYDRYVQTGTIINETLVTEMKQQNVNSLANQSLSEWIQMKVIPVYTVTSITYCRSLPGFIDFCAEDQATLIRLGQSSTRILAACIHWYDAEHMDFKNFLSWRSSDLFKTKSVRHAQRMHALEIDHIEAALLNVATLIATDYPGLKNPAAIEDLRRNILSAFRAYTTAKFGTPNQRIETLFSFVPEIRSLGMLHYKMTKTLSLQAEDVMKSS